MNIYSPSGVYVMLSIAAGVVELVSIFLFFYNMLMTLLPSAQQPH
jgi:hypothetical protein